MPLLTKFNSLPKDKILYCSKLKAIEDRLVNLTQKLKFLLRSVEHFVGKEENVGYQHFILIPKWFQSFSL